MMLSLTNVSVNYGRLKADTRTHFFDAKSAPIFTWGVISNRKNAFQSACRIKLSCDGFFWDSGIVKTKEQKLVYFGGPIPQGKPVSLSLTIFDDIGNESKEYTDFVYNASTDWQGKWICSNNDSYTRAVYLRREFTIDKPIKSAVYYAFTAGYQKLFINGQELDSAALDPAFTDFSKTAMYVMYPEFEKHLTTGKNCLGAIIGEGWRRNAFCMDKVHRRIPYSGRPTFTAQLKIEYEDGSTDWIVSDESWQCGSGMIVRNDIFDGVTYDANRESPNWNKAGSIGFEKAEICPPVCENMRPMTLEPIIEHRILAPTSKWNISENSTVYDFGQNIAGVIRVRLPKMRNRLQLTVLYAEEINEDGTLFTAPLRTAKCVDRYIASGDERDIEVFQPIFTYHGFRYAMIDTDIDVLGVEAVELHTDLENNSFFRCGDPMVNAIHELVVNTERANQHGILTDCPQRDERMGWLNDATVRFEETPYNFDIGRMFPKIIRDIIESQHKSGGISDTAPYVTGHWPGDPVNMSFLVAAKEAYEHTGNIEIIKEAYDKMRAWGNYLIQNSCDNILEIGTYGDWASPTYVCELNSIGDGAVSSVTPVPFMSTGYMYFAAKTLSGFASLIGDESEKAAWAKAAENIKNAMLQKWYDEKTGRISTGSQACQAFALWLGIIPEKDRKKAARIIHDELTQNGFMLTTGNLCTKYIFEVLSEYGYLEDAWTLITRQEYPSLGFMLQNEATTVWERFELKKAPGMNSHNHPMYGALGSWFYEYIAGIQPLDKAFDEILIKPFFPKKLLYAQAGVDTVKGDVSVRWFKRYGKTTLQVNIPFGSRAKVILGKNEYSIGSGFYTFEEELK